ncbi:MAG TPA: HGxxPAAW family protein [Actinotalea caeni]|uniref:HGxxPAAW family protein n=1 Tax=Actinotalea caeni TaxID=1348467 RepID=UPI0012E231F5|nr:HGxxPAAW family protein [Actinotalea caeni]HLV56178.1 HGxxPAAW family protein [Actinotalea caeni]
MEQQSIIVRQVGSEPVEEPVVLPDAAPHANEGKTVAGWTLMYVCALGATIVAIGMIIPSTPVIVAGVVVTVLGLALGAILRAMGHGQPRVTKNGDVVA